MTALFVRPLPYSVVSANDEDLYPASNGNVDEPGLVWRSDNLTSVNMILDLGTSASYDTVAVVGSNLRSTDTVQIRTGTTSSGTGNYAGTATAAYSGSVPSGGTAKSIYRLGSTRTERYMRLDFVATSHPDGYVAAQRIVVGKAVTSAGIDINAEKEFVDQSIAYEGPGWRSFDEYPVLVSWKFTVSFVSETIFRSDWHPFLMNVGRKKAFLFVPDVETNANYQTDAIFGRLVSDAKAPLLGYDAWTLDLRMLALAP